MGKDDSVRHLVAILEPLVEDLDDKKRLLSEKKNEQESISRLIAYTKDNYEMVGIYADQDIIINNLEKLNYSKEDYRTSCYLLKSENDSVKALPQYQEASNLISNVMEYFKKHKQELLSEIQDLSIVCEKKELEKKYYDILSCINPLIENVHEFVDFMKKHELPNEEIIKILYSTIRDNMTNYKLKSN